MTIAYGVMDIRELYTLTEYENRGIIGMPKGTTYPLPAGTPFFIRYITGEVSPRYGIYGTHEVDDRYTKNTMQKMNTYIATKIIPQGGRSVMRDVAGKQGIKYIIVHEEGEAEEVEVSVIQDTCEECGGVFVRAMSHMGITGEYVCQGCGLVYEPKEDDVIPEPYIDSAESWKEAIAIAPADEVRARAKAVSRKARDIKAKDAFANLRGHEVYENKWTSKTREYRRFRALALIKEGGMTTGTLIELLGTRSRQFYELIADLETTGRIRSEKVGRAKKLIFIR